MLATLVPALAQIEKWAMENRQKKIRRATNDLSFPYQIDFVTESALPDYLALIEKQVALVRGVDWPVPEPPKLDSENTIQREKRFPVVKRSCTWMNIVQRAWVRNRGPSSAGASITSGTCWPHHKWHTG